MSKIYFVAIVGSIGPISAGLFFGWASPSLPRLIADGDELPHLSVEEASWVASTLIIGSFFGAFVGMFIMNFIGRKNSMITTTVPTTIGWLMIAFATSPWELYIARFICGVSFGIIYLITPVYLGEISPAKIRGILGMICVVSMKCGTLFAYVIGPFLSIRNFSFVCMTIPVLYVITFIRFMPESPYYLMRRNDRQKAVKALVQLRGNENVSKEADIIEQVVKIDLANETGFKEILFVPGNRRAMLTVIGVSIIQQFSGAPVFLQYSETLFNQTHTNLEGKYLTIILGCVQVISMCVCMILIDYCGRRILLMISSLGMGCSTAMVGAYFYLLSIHANVDNLEWFPATGTILFMILYSVGFSSLPFTLFGELFPTNVKALAGLIFVSICNLNAFIAIKWYPTMSNSVGTHVVFWFFTILNLLGFVFIFAYVPETKGKTLEQIQEELNVQKKQVDS
ncbi:PREDICTED: facilitated trehalose transporter Tret1-like [Dinoponera quadriceps]|uniref:Facilitated trehalose transporter Tret1-like n=1 Tax=Dinoponera quadriceps TaxID=609295 RepID=A0A6P3WV91_DINQU|nr:PREDICTED: facilitated trehalose transporter Tret1-like [Dinoponera quadriceps]